MFKRNAPFLLILALFTLPAFANPMAQRGCHPDDLQFGLNTNQTTNCVWEANQDVSMSLTLHADNRVHVIKSACLFTPGNPSNDDAIIGVIGHKAAGISNLVINGNAINFDVYRTNTDNNLNVLFYLNKSDDSYTPGDKLQCSFSSVS